MTDFLIIGGGIAGVSAAARLSHLGSVVLLEGEDHLAHHASGRSAALYEPYYGLAPVVELSLASGAYFHAGSGLLAPRGVLIVARAGEEEAFFNDIEVMEMAQCGPEEARSRFPILNDSITHAAFAAHAWDIDTDRLIQAFAKEARANGAQIITKAHVTAVKKTKEGWSAVTGNGDFDARILVNAAGAWADQVAQTAGLAPLGLQPMRRSMARIPAPTGLDPSSWPMTFGVGETWYCKPDAGALIVSPAEEHPMDPHDAWADDMVLAEGLARYEAHVNAPVTRLISTWAGLRTFAPDRVPVIGFAPQDPSFFWLAGQGGYGFQSAPAASQLVADLIGGQAQGLSRDLVTQLSPQRFA